MDMNDIPTLVPPSRDAVFEAAKQEVVDRILLALRTAPVEVELEPNAKRKWDSDDDEIDPIIEAKERTIGRLAAENMVLRAKLAVLIAKSNESEASFEAFTRKVDRITEGVTRKADRASQAIAELHAKIDGLTDRKREAAKNEAARASEAFLRRERKEPA